MRTRFLAAAGIAALLIAGCDNAEETNANPPPTDTEAASGERAQDALGEAAESARQTMESLGEAGRAGLEALQENAPAIREGVENAGDRLRNAANALVRDPDAAPVDAEGDSSGDPDEVPESRETPQ